VHGAHLAMNLGDQSHIQFVDLLAKIIY